MSAFSLNLGGGNFGGFGISGPFRFGPSDPLSEKSPTTAPASEKTGSSVLDVIGAGLNIAGKAFGAYEQADLLSQQIKYGQRPSIVQGENGIPQGEKLSEIVRAGGSAAGAVGGGFLGGLSVGTLVWAIVGIVVLMLVFRR